MFVLFGELFGHGYVNGLIDEARAAGMTIIGTTVGRHDETGALRALTTEEHTEAEEKLGGRIVNVPWMAGRPCMPWFRADRDMPICAAARVRRPVRAMATNADKSLNVSFAIYKIS